MKKHKSESEVTWEKVERDIYHFCEPQSSYQKRYRRVQDNERLPLGLRIKRAIDELERRLNTEL